MSTDHQQELTDYGAEATDQAEKSTEVDAPAWEPNTRSTSGKQCQECGAPVDKQLARVFGGNDNEMHGCYNCMDRTAVREGGAVDGGPER